jgi:hypothetical protein
MASDLLFYLAETHVPRDASLAAGRHFPLLGDPSLVGVFSTNEFPASMTPDPSFGLLCLAAPGKE